MAEVLATTQYGNSFNKQDSTITSFTTYKNTLSKPILITGISMVCGVAMNGGSNYYTWGGSAAGTGQAISASFTAKINAVTVSTTRTESISKTVGRVQGSGGYYPKYADCATSTFTFNSPIILKPNETLTADLTKGTNNCFVLNRQNSVIRIKFIYSDLGARIYDGTEWKYAIPYIYNGSEWKQALPYVYNGSEWKMGC